MAVPVVRWAQSTEIRAPEWAQRFARDHGSIGSVAATYVLRSLLFATSPWDKATMLFVLSLLGTAFLLATYFPARRAASVNPNEALRSD